MVACSWLANDVSLGCLRHGRSHHRPGGGLALACVGNHLQASDQLDGHRPIGRT
ncbi:MAG: hypothetical protein JNJ46_12595 [Myxococcales bacterium]|nr:hypothetical protein [Myxococcales bacterium]